MTPHRPNLSCVCWRTNFDPGMEDRGQVYLVPKTAKLCLVQIEDTLTPTTAQAWQTEGIVDIAPKTGAAEALGEARKSGYDIVYLALAADRPLQYQKMRGWVRYRSSEGTPPLPDGAVLSRFTLPEQDQQTNSWRKTVEMLAGRVVAPAMAIAGTVEVARQFHAAGVRTLYLGAAGELPKDVERVAGWEQVVPLFEKGKENK